MSSINLNHAVWDNKEVFTEFFKGYKEAIIKLYTQVKEQGEVIKGNDKAWIELLSEDVEGLCIQTEKDDIQRGYLFLFEKFSLGNLLTRFYLFYPNWKEDFNQLTAKQIIKRCDYYNQFTDNIEGVQKIGVDKPNLEFFKEHLREILKKENFLSGIRLFDFVNGFNEMFKMFSELKSKFTEQQLLELKENAISESEINCSEFIYYGPEFIEAGDVLLNLIGSDEIPYSQKAKIVNEKLTSFYQKNFQFTGYDIAELYQKCKKKRARSKKSALEARYSKAWISKTKGAKDMLVIDWNNWNGYSYGFLIDEIKEDFAFFTCYRVYEKCSDDIEKRPKKEHIELLQDYYTNYADGDKKPHLHELLKNYEAYTPIFKYQEAKGKLKKSIYTFEVNNGLVYCDFEKFVWNGRDIAQAVNLIDTFEYV